MNGPQDEGGFLAKLRRNERLNSLSGGRPELLIFGAPALLIALIVGAVVVVAVTMGGGGDDDKQASGGTPQVTKTSVAASPTAGANAGLLTPIAVSPGSELTLADLAARGAGEPARGEFKGERLIIPSINVDAPFSYKRVPVGGQMPNPNGPDDVAFYDFADFPGLGGLPNAGGNVVVAGHVDYIRHGPAVFWDLSKLKAGDRVQIRTTDGTVVEYQIEFNKSIEAGDADWTAIVAGTAQESITLITCGGEFSAGHYSNRQILWGRRVT